MITGFGNLMIYVHDVRAVANFWVHKLGFIELHEHEFEGEVIGVDITHNPDSDAGITLYDRAVVATMSPEVNLGAPSVLFTAPDVTEMRELLISDGVTVGDVVTHGDMTSFNFSDPEGNWFAVKEVPMRSR